MIPSSPSHAPSHLVVRGGLFHDPHRLVIGDAPLVGVLDVPGTVKRPPIRLYYPAELAPSSSHPSSSSSSSSSSRWWWWRRKGTTKMPRRAGYFVNDRVAYFLQGYAHVAIARRDTRMHAWVLRPLLWFLSYLLPVRYMGVPGTAHVRGMDDADIVRYAADVIPKRNHGDGSKGSNDESGRGGGTTRLVVFSHGLTGTGEENTIFCSSLARRGYVVVSVHHRDGSSCRAPSHDGSDCVYYEHFPTTKEEGFDPRNRLRQVRVRAREFLTCRSYIVGGGDHDDEHDDDVDAEHRRVVLDQIRPQLDDGDGAIAAGFSYGAATAALAATMMPEKFRCAVLLDPWLHIDYTSRGLEFDFPPEAFGSGWPSSSELTSSADEDDDATRGGGGGGLNIPSVFINSSQFCGYEKLYGATRRLADRINGNDPLSPSRAEMHVIPDTMHSNFCDIVFWIPRRLLGKAFGLGNANAYDVHEEILDKTVHFLRRH